MTFQYELGGKASRYAYPHAFLISCELTSMILIEIVMHFSETKAECLILEDLPSTLSEQLSWRLTSFFASCKRLDNPTLRWTVSQF